MLSRNTFCGNDRYNATPFKRGGGDLDEARGASHLRDLSTTKTLLLYSQQFLEYLQSKREGGIIIA